MAERRVQLTRLDPEVINFNNYGVYRMRIEVTEVQGPDLDTNLFVYKHVGPSPYSDNNFDTFEAVCGPAQLSDYPPGAANADQGWPFYRLDYVELDFQSAAQADSVWTEIKSSVTALVNALNKLDRLKQTETVWIPGPPDPTSESASMSQ